MSRDAKSLLKFVLQLLPICFAFQVLLDFPFVVGFSQFRLLTDQTTGRLNLWTTVFFVTILLWIYFPRRKRAARPNGVLNVFSNRSVRSAMGFGLIILCVVGLRLFAIWAVISIDLVGPAASLERVLTGLGPFGQRYFGNSQIPCVIEMKGEDGPRLFVRREDRESLVMALDKAGIDIKK